MTVSIEEIRHIQKIELMILLKFDDFCKKNNIQYYLGGGTLLGAVRHHGFIPWDDDIDVMMTSANYKKLCKLWENNNNDAEYFFQTPRTDIEFHDHLAKLRLLNTVYATKTNLKFPDMKNGFFIDIFSHNKTSSNSEIRKMHIFLTQLSRSMVYHKWMNTPMQYYGKHKIICKLVTFIISLFSIHQLEKLRDFIITFFDESKSSFLFDGYGEHLTHGAFPSSILDEGIKMSFEGHMFPVPRRYDEYLRFSYGAKYMQLPPESERKPHHEIAQIDFGRWN